jgi:hypothetical protein
MLHRCLIVIRIHLLGRSEIKDLIIVLPLRSWEDTWRSLLLSESLGSHVGRLE